MLSVAEVCALLTAFQALWRRYPQLERFFSTAPGYSTVTSAAEKWRARIRWVIGLTRGETGCCLPRMVTRCGIRRVIRITGLETYNNIVQVACALTGVSFLSDPDTPVPVNTEQGTAFGGGPIDDLLDWINTMSADIGYDSEDESFYSIPSSRATSFASLPDSVSLDSGSGEDNTQTGAISRRRRSRFQRAPLEDVAEESFDSSRISGLLDEDVNRGESPGDVADPDSWLD